MGFKDGFGKMVGAAKGMVGVGESAGRAAGSAVASRRVADRVALKAGAKYVDIGTPNQKFNASGFLPK